MNLPYPFDNASDVKANPEGSIRLVDRQGKSLARVPMTTGFELSEAKSGYGDGVGFGDGSGYCIGHGSGDGSGSGFGPGPDGGYGYGDGDGSGKSK